MPQSSIVIVEELEVQTLAADSGAVVLPLHETWTRLPITQPPETSGQQSCENQLTSLV